MTVDDRGTIDRADDVLLPGASYAVVPDDGDGVFDRTKDGPVIYQVSDPSGIVVVRDLPQAAYWVVETVAPPGFTLANAAPFHPTTGLNGQSCFSTGNLTCFADPAGGGMTAVFVVNSPLPATSAADDYRNPIVIILAIAALIVVIVGVWQMLLKRQEPPKGPTPPTT